MVRSYHHHKFIQTTLAKPQKLFQQDEILTKFNLKIHMEFIKEFISYIKRQETFISQEIIYTAVYLAHVFYYHNLPESTKYSYERTKIPMLVAAIKMTLNWLPINADDKIKQIVRSVPPIKDYEQKILTIANEIDDFCRSFSYIPPIFHIRNCHQSLCGKGDNKVGFDDNF